MHIATTYTEKELVEGCKQENPRIQRALYQKYYRLMFSICLRYSENREDAQDILQDGFVKVFKKINTFKHKGSFEGWVRRIMVHTAIEHYRKKSKYFMVDINEAYDQSFDADALVNLSTAEIIKLVQELPAGYRTVFNLFVIEGYSHQEIADMLNISEGTSKSQLSRAKKMLKLRMKFLNAKASG